MTNRSNHNHRSDRNDAPKHEYARSMLCALGATLASRYSGEDELVAILLRTLEVARRSKTDMEGRCAGYLEAATWVRDHARCVEDLVVANLLIAAAEADLARLRGDEEGARSAQQRCYEAACAARQTMREEVSSHHLSVL